MALNASSSTSISSDQGMIQPQRMHERMRAHMCACTGFEKFNNLERARYYHDEMVKAGLAPRAGQGAEGGVSHPELSSLRSHKHQVHTCNDNG